MRRQGSIKNSLRTLNISVVVDELNWQKIAEHKNEIDFSPNRIAVVEVAGKKICIADADDGLFAFSVTCPHAGGRMADGYLDGVGHVAMLEAPETTARLVLGMVEGRTVPVPTAG